MAVPQTRALAQPCVAGLCLEVPAYFIKVWSPFLIRAGEVTQCSEDHVRCLIRATKLLPTPSLAHPW